MKNSSMHTGLRSTAISFSPVVATSLVPQGNNLFVPGYLSLQVCCQASDQHHCSPSPNLSRLLTFPRFAQWNPEIEPLLCEFESTACTSPNSVPGILRQFHRRGAGLKSYGSEVARPVPRLRPIELPCAIPLAIDRCAMSMIP